MFSSPTPKSDAVNQDEFIVHTMSKDLEQTKKLVSKQYDAPVAAPAKQSLVKPVTPTKITPLPPKTSSPFLFPEKKVEEEKPIIKTQPLPAPMPKPTAVTKAVPITTQIPVNTSSNPFTGPFHIPQPSQQIIPSTTSDKIIIKEALLLPKIAPKQNGIDLSVKTNKPFLIAAASTLIILSGGSFYFFYFNNKQVDVSMPVETVETMPEPIAIETPVPVVPPTEIPPVETTPTETPATLSIDKPNYLSINTATVDDISIKESLKKYSADVLAMNATTPIEFVVTDSLNNPLSFADFANKLKLGLSAATLTDLTDKFSLFIYLDQGNPKVGLAIGIKNQTALKTTLKKEETTLVTGLAPLYLDIPYSASAVKFSDSKYKEVPIRFYNIISPTQLSIDYLLTTDKLIIGTTRVTTTSIYDYLIK